MKFHKLLKILTLVAFIICPEYLFSQAKSIKISIPNIKSDKGEILIALFNKSDGFPENVTTAYQTAKLKAKKGLQSITLQNISDGRYALAIFHDENGDEKMNKNMLGIPKEGYGVSNNVKNLMSAPTFKEAAFIHNRNSELSIQLNY
jgi:uncharacterized protein (DUF2141 family)